MTAPNAEPLIRDYLARLQGELADLPPTRRQEIMEEIADHIEEERGRLTAESDADLQNLLDRIGDPAELAAAASTQGNQRDARPRTNRAGALEILALVGTPIIWPLGVILLWTSPAWSTRDKIIGTLAPPGGYLALLVLYPMLLLAGPFTTVCTSGTTSTGGGPTVQTPMRCTGLLTTLPDWAQVAIGVAFITVSIALWLLPILVGVYLGRRLRWGARAAAAQV